MGKSIFHKVILVALLLSVVAATALVTFIAYLIFTSYQGHSPSDVNGLLFPIAIFYLVIIGAPLGGLIGFLFWGLDKTRPLTNANTTIPVEPPRQ